ncbi:MAG: flagellar basal body P-ring formation chaperone FlgA [Rhodospirillaceae bacterium]
MDARKYLLTAIVALALLPLAAGQALGNGERIRKGDPAPKAEASAPLLSREAITVEGRIVYLGDLFVNAGEHADVAVAYAPEPGERAIFDARWLYRVARAYRMKWRPISAQQQTIVQRASQVIERADIEDTILAALVEKGAEPDSLLELNVQLTRLHVPTNVQATVGIDDITYDPRTKRFATILSAPAKDPAGRKLRLTGRLHAVVKIPVAARVLGRNETIADRDVKWIKVRADMILPDTIIKAEDIVGMAAKRGLRPDTLVRQSDVERPVLVERNSIVTVTLVYGPMALSAQGKSLEKGSLGDVIRVKNKRSKAVFEAKVTGPGRAEATINAAAELADNRR